MMREGDDGPVVSEAVFSKRVATHRNCLSVEKGFYSTCWFTKFLNCRKGGPLVKASWAALLFVLEGELHPMDVRGHGQH